MIDWLLQNKKKKTGWNEFEGGSRLNVEKLFLLFLGECCHWGCKQNAFFDCSFVCLREEQRGEKEWRNSNG